MGRQRAAEEVLGKRVNHSAAEPQKKIEDLKFEISDSRTYKRAAILN
jgi:hypothetical protein